MLPFPCFFSVDEFVGKSESVEELEGWVLFERLRVCVSALRIPTDGEDEFSYCKRAYGGHSRTHGLKTPVATGGHRLSWVQQGFNCNAFVKC